MKKRIVFILAQLFPRFFIKKGFSFLTTPGQQKIRPHEKAIIRQAIKTELNFKHFIIQCYRWGTGSKVILLVHGWEGHAGNFSDIIPKLVESNFTVYAFDGPGHGASTLGATSLFDFQKLTALLVEQFSATYVLSHSFGSVAALTALGSNPQLIIERYVGITVPNKFNERIAEMIEYFGLPNKIFRGIVQKIEHELGVKVADLNVEDFAPKSSVKKALFLHDKNDRVLPIERSIEVAKKWKVAQLETVEGTGHYKILRTPKVIDRIVCFLSS